MKVRQKSGMILENKLFRNMSMIFENKVFQKLKLSRYYFIKTCPPKLSIIEKRIRKIWMTIDIENSLFKSDFGINCHSLYSQNTTIYFKHVEFWPKNLAFEDPTSKKFYNPVNHKMCGYQAPCRSRISMQEKTVKKSRWSLFYRQVIILLSSLR